jgi:DNA-binding GntR family transcriptional regulator
VRQPGVSLRSTVLTALREGIIHRLLPPGTHLVEDEVAARLSVSRNPIREAFRSLEQEGWVVAYPGAGVYVAEPSPEDALDLLEVRGALESLAARLAAEHATDSQVAQFDALLGLGRAATERGDVPTLVDLNRDFHLLVAEASGNRELMRSLPAMSDKIRWLFSAVVIQRVVSSWKEHAQLAKAIGARDPELAMKVAGAHVARTRSSYESWASGGG